jgi:hypothetical protein
MAAGSDLVARSGDLKRALLDFARRRRFTRSFRQALEQRFSAGAAVDESAFANFLDYFVLQHRLPDRRTVVEHFVAEHPELPEEERAMLLGWQDVVEGIFEVRRRAGEALVVVNLVDELTYRVRSNLGRPVFARMRPRSFLIARLIPVGDEWLLSGVSSVLPARDRAEAYRWAAELAARHPALVFRNPEKLARAWELQREERRHFVAFFGSDLVVLPGRELAERMQAYTHFRMYEARDAEGKSAADRAKQLYGRVPKVPDFGLPDELCEAETVGLIYDEVEGLNFYANFGTVAEAFANPERAAERRYRQAVLEYLQEPSISPLPLRRLAERDPERASRLFQRVLRQPKFSWERDGEALLRRYKVDYFERPALPSVTPLGEALARAQMAASDAGEARPARRRPARRSNTGARRR